MKPVNREDQLRSKKSAGSTGAKSRIKVAKPRQNASKTAGATGASGAAAKKVVHQPKGNGAKPNPDNIFRPKRNSSRHGNNKKAAVIPTKYKAAGAGLAGIALIGMGAAAYSGHENSSEQNSKATMADDSSSTTTSVYSPTSKSKKDKTSSKNTKSHKKSTSKKDKKNDDDTINLNDLLIRASLLVHQAVTRI